MDIIIIIIIIIVGIKAQEDNMLGLGLLSKDAKRFKEGQIVI